MTDKWKALERLRMRVAGGNHADEDCNIINRAFRDLEQRTERDRIEMRILWDILKQNEDMEKQALVLVMVAAPPQEELPPLPVLPEPSSVF